MAESDDRVYAVCDAEVAFSGGQIRLRPGMSAARDAAIVRERPDLFSDELPPPEIPGAYADPHVREPERHQRPPAKIERGTRAPGERRP